MSRYNNNAIRSNHFLLPWYVSYHLVLHFHFQTFRDVNIQLYIDRCPLWCIVKFTQAFESLALQYTFTLASRFTLHRNCIDKSHNMIIRLLPVLISLSIAYNPIQYRSLVHAYFANICRRAKAVEIIVMYQGGFAERDRDFFDDLTSATGNSKQKESLRCFQTEHLITYRTMFVAWDSCIAIQSEEFHLLVENLERLATSSVASIKSIICPFFIYYAICAHQNHSKRRSKSWVEHTILS